MRSTVTIAVALLATVLLASSAADGSERSAREVAGPAATVAWTPAVRAARRYAKRRAGTVRFSLIDPRGRRYRFRAGGTETLASTYKVMLMAAYLRRKSVRRRALHRSERRLLGPMIKRSDDAAASELHARLGRRRVERLAERAGMTRFRYEPQIWGYSTATARGLNRLMRRLRQLIPDRHERYAFRLLASITSSQRWGIGRVKPDGWKLYFKGGWGQATGLRNHQIARLERGHCTVSLAILTARNPNHDYGSATLKGVAKRLLRGLERSSC